MAKLTLEAGCFYKSRSGDVWCCHRVDPLHLKILGNAHNRAHCIRVDSHNETEYFYIDGGYAKSNADGKAGHMKDLIEQCGPNGESLLAAAFKKIENFGIPKPKAKKTASRKKPR